MDASDVVLDTKIEPLMRPYKKSNIAFYNEFYSANHNTILGSHKKRKPGVVYGIVSFVLRNKNTMDHIADGMLKIVGEDETYISTITGTELIEASLGAQIVKAVAVDYQLESVDINVTDVPQVIEILMTPLVS